MTVDETFHNDHRVVSQTTAAGTVDKPSKFTFTAADSGLHKLCFTPQGSAAVSLQGWFSGHDSAKGGTRLMLDMAIGESSKIESEDKEKIDSIVGKVRELNGRLADVRREQMFQRVRLLQLFTSEAGASELKFNKHIVVAEQYANVYANRSEKLNSEISPNQRTRRSYDTHWCNYWFWQQHAHGN